MTDDAILAQRERLARAALANPPGSWATVQELAAALQATLAELRAAWQWQPITTAPKDGSRILLLSAAYQTPCGDHGSMLEHLPECATGSWNGDCWSSGNDWFEPNEVTHWQPLLPPPK